MSAKISGSQRITPFLWFDNQLEEAVNFYISIFNDSKITMMSRYGDAGPGPKGTVMTASFELCGQEFMGLNGGPHFNFSPAISFFVHCETQEEVDYFWEKLSADGGKTNQCGWLDDRFGLSWQVVPDTLMQLLHKSDPAKSQKVMQAMMKMTKIIIKDLEEAYNS